MNAVAILVFLALSYLPAYMLLRSWLLALPLSAATTVYLYGLAGTLAVVTGVRPIVLSTFLICSANTVAALSWFRRRPDIDVSLRGTSRALLFLPAVLAATMFPPPTVGWDPRSIWWFHASWFLDSADTVVEGMRNPVLAWSHPTYPPGIPASIAALWSVTGGEDLALAQALTATITGLAVGGLVITLFVANPTVQTGLAVGALSLLATGLAGGTSAYGYVDVAFAAFLVTAVAASVCLDDETHAKWVVALSLGAAMSTKSEAGVFALAAIPIILGFTVHPRKVMLRAIGVASLPLIAWRATALGVGTPSDSSVEIGTLFRREITDRFTTATHAVFSELAISLGLATVALLVLVLALGVDNAAELRVTFALLASSASIAVLTIGVYTFGAPEIEWWLGTSLQRIASTSHLFAFAGVVTMVAALQKLVRSPPDSQNAYDDGENETAGAL